MRIGIDLDETVADLNTDWFALVNKDWTHVHGEFMREKCTSFDLSVCHPIGAKIYEYLLSPNLFRNLKSIPGAIETLKKSAAAGDEQVVITDASNDGYIETQKHIWVAEKMPWVRKVYIINSAVGETKADICRLAKLDVLFDDAPKHIEAVAQQLPHIKLAAVAYPWNESVKHLVHSYHPQSTAWTAFEHFLNNLRDHG